MIFMIKNMSCIRVKKKSSFFSGGAILGIKESSMVECFNVIDCEK